MARALATCALALLVACGSDGSATTGGLIQAEDVETLLVQRERQRHPSLRVGEARCPDGVVASEGKRFGCRLDVEGVDALFEVTLSEVSGANVSYDIRPALAIIDVAAVADFVRSRLGADWSTAEVNCGPAKARLLDVGAVLECTVFNGTVTRYIQAVVEDRAGTVVLRER